jgi:hypothetical protein
LIGGLDLGTKIRKEAETTIMKTGQRQKGEEGFSFF